MIFKYWNGKDKNTLNEIKRLKEWAISEFTESKSEKGSTDFQVNSMDYKNSECAFEIIENGKTVSALIVQRFESPEYAFIAWAATLPEYRGQGYCSKLVDKAKAVLESEDSQLMSVHCFDQYLEQDSAFWAKFGFKHHVFKKDGVTHLSNIRVID
ncbi:GNAT family N-acetyltransferase [Photobacterium leiognathi]|uniref:GNAT family N-acetyltransferase n=1 Tax=Photobacterium leiognathi TaxID=553611 RepID=UPI0027387AC1|nr:GNAT family N-acetyltransferase [Photobacterium leiognathi]